MKKWIICSGPDWYRPSVTSTKQLIRLFKENGYSVLWVNPIAFKSPFVNSANRKSAFDKITNKLIIHLRWLRRDSKNQWILVPLYIPSFSNLADRLNRWFVGAQVHLICLILGIYLQETILWISGNFTAEILLDWPFKQKVYQAADLISAFRNASPNLKKKLKVRERNMCNKSNYIFASSERILEKLVSLCGSARKIHLLHHGVDFKHFSKPVNPSDKILKIKSLKRPIAGYFGSLSDANDKNVFLTMAEKGFSVVIIGKPMGDYTELQKNNNIHFLGAIPYSELPSYATLFDVALLNWRMHEWILNCFPVKALEYLAIGLPVVSCKIPVLMEHFSKEISFVENSDEFAVEAKRLIANDSFDLREKRRQSVRGWDWKSRFNYIQRTLCL